MVALKAFAWSIMPVISSKDNSFCNGFPASDEQWMHCRLHLFVISMEISFNAGIVEG